MHLPAAQEATRIGLAIADVQVGAQPVGGGLKAQVVDLVCRADGGQRQVALPIAGKLSDRQEAAVANEARRHAVDAQVRGIRTLEIARR